MCTPYTTLASERDEATLAAEELEQRIRVLEDRNTSSTMEYEDRDMKDAEELKRINRAVTLTLLKCESFLRQQVVEKEEGSSNDSKIRRPSKVETKVNKIRAQRHSSSSRGESGIATDDEKGNLTTASDLLLEIEELLRLAYKHQS